MTLTRKNGLHGTYYKYLSRQVKSLCDQIPKDRKENLLEKIKAKAFLIGCNNQSALNNAIKHLGQPVEPKKED